MQFDLQGIDGSALVSDGIVEANNHEGELFGLERF